MVFTLQRFSNGSHHLIKIHCSAHFHVPTIRAVGVANQSAHGQAITITAEKYNNDVPKSAPNKKNRIRKTIIAIIITAGTKNDDILSANHCMGALDHCAS